MSQYTVTVVGATGKTGRHVARGAAARGWRVTIPVHDTVARLAGRPAFSALDFASRR
jgi:uncharacterized protein YbjT (DUF2867 family)